MNHKHTAVSLLAWLNENLKDRHNKDVPFTDSDLCWYFAYREAQANIDINSTKDWARVFLDGLPAIASDSAIALYFQIWESEAGDSLDDDQPDPALLAEANADLENDVRTFFSDGDEE